MTSEEDQQIQNSKVASASTQDRPPQRIHCNRMMLDLRQRVQWQSQVIRDLKAERDRLTKELASRLFFVEAQLLREQKHIEALLSEKDHVIHFQALQIQSLKCLLSKIDWSHHRHQRCARGENSGSSSSCSRRNTKMPPPLSKRYSVALDEYMKDNGVISRALPVIVQVDSERESKEFQHRKQHVTCTRTRSLPELRSTSSSECDDADWTSRREHCYDPLHQCGSVHSLSRDVIDELAVRRWTSDCDSEHSDSLDSGISSPSIKSRNIHLDETFALAAEPAETKPISSSPRRCSSLGNFINRTFSSSSGQLEKIKGDPQILEQNGRRNSSFSVINTNDISHQNGQTENNVEKQKSSNRFISSANRNFGTNHRSVTKPRDIKFRKLFKFRRRAEVIDQSNVSEDYMTV